MEIREHAPEACQLDRVEVGSRWLEEGLEALRREVEAMFSPPLPRLFAEISCVARQPLDRRRLRRGDLIGPRGRDDERAFAFFQLVAVECRVFRVVEAEQQWPDAR